MFETIHTNECSVVLHSRSAGNEIMVNTDFQSYSRRTEQHGLLFGVLLVAHHNP